MPRFTMENSTLPCLLCYTCYAFMCIKTTSHRRAAALITGKLIGPEPSAALDAYNTLYMKRLNPVIYNKRMFKNHVDVNSAFYSLSLFL